MAQFPCLPLWTDSWIADTNHLSRLERGTYFDLLVLMWRTPGCKVPNDNDWLAKHLRLTLPEVATELRSIINEFCQTDGNWIHQKRLQREFARRFEQGAAQSARAKHPRKKKKVSSPELAEIHDPAKPPEPEPEQLKDSSFPTAAREGAKRKKKIIKAESDRSLATARTGSARFANGPLVSASLEEIVKAKGWAK